MSSVIADVVEIEAVHPHPNADRLFLARIKGHIRYQALSHVTPLAVPVLLEIGQELVYGGGVAEAILDEAAEDLVRDAMQRSL